MAEQHAPRCSALAHLIGRIWIKIFGWKLEGAAPPIAKCVFIAAPHTSNWDMPHMLGASWALGLRVAWMGKKQIFRWPFGGFMKALGGIPIDRTTTQNTVERVAQLFEESDGLYLVIPVSGTRARTDYWKSGFYHIAHGANVPIICSYLDYGKAVTGVDLVLETTGDISADMDKLREFYGPFDGRHPEMKSRIRLREEEATPDDAAAANG